MLRLGLIVAAALAVVSTAVFAGPAALRPDAVAGVYKHRFQLHMATGETLDSENVLEVVPTASTAAYVRVRLNLTNGRICALHGVAHVDGPDLVYRAPPLMPGEPACILRIRPRPTSVGFVEDRSCRDYCGAFVGFDQASFSASSRRPIRYMARLRNSSEFKEALAEDTRRSTAR